MSVVSSGSSWKTILTFAREDDALEASGLLLGLEAWQECTLGVCERGATWIVESYDGGALACSTGAHAIEMLRASGLRPVCVPVREAVPDADWVALSQKSLPPVKAGRFIVHGGHDRHRVSSSFAIEIDAGRAFGTAHHPTTRGCLLALDRLGSRLEGASLLDLGTGAGVLAIAAAKSSKHRARVLGVDIDPIAVEVARENILRNGVRASVRTQTGDGRKLGATARSFDAAVANILARPLIELAPRLRAAVRVGGVAILSGFLTGHADDVAAVYIAHGFSKMAAFAIEGWTTLILIRRQ